MPRLATPLVLLLLASTLVACGSSAAPPPVTVTVSPGPITPGTSAVSSQGNSGAPHSSVQAPASSVNPSSPEPTTDPAAWPALGTRQDTPEGTAVIYSVESWSPDPNLAGASVFRPGIAMDVEVTVRQDTEVPYVTHLDYWSAQDKDGRVYPVSIFGGKKPAFPSAEPVPPGGSARGWVLIDTRGAIGDMVFRLAVRDGFLRWSPID